MPRRRPTDTDTISNNSASAAARIAFIGYCARSLLHARAGPGLCQTCPQASLRQVHEIGSAHRVELRSRDLVEMPAKCFRRPRVEVGADRLAGQTLICR